MKFMGTAWQDWQDKAKLANKLKEDCLAAGNEILAGNLCDEIRRSPNSGVKMRKDGSVLQWKRNHQKLYTVRMERPNKIGNYGTTEFFLNTETKRISKVVHTVYVDPQRPWKFRFDLETGRMSTDRRHGNGVHEEAVYNKDGKLESLRQYVNLSGNRRMRGSMDEDGHITGAWEEKGTAETRPIHPQPSSYRELNRFLAQVKQYDQEQKMLEKQAPPEWQEGMMKLRNGNTYYLRASLSRANNPALYEVFKSNGLNCWAEGLTMMYQAYESNRLLLRAKAAAQSERELQELVARQQSLTTYMAKQLRQCYEGLKSVLQPQDLGWLERHMGEKYNALQKELTTLPVPKNKQPEASQESGGEANRTNSYSASNRNSPVVQPAYPPTVANFPYIKK